MENRKKARTKEVSKKPRILYLITQGILGGPRTHINHLISFLKNDYEIHVAVGAKYCMPNYLEEGEIPLHVIPSLERPINPWKDQKALGEIKALITKIKPDLISTHSSKAGILGRYAAKKCEVPALFTAHGWAFTEGVSELQRKLYIQIEKRMARYAQKIICVSEHDHQLALQYGVGQKEQLVTIQNAMPFFPDQPLAGLAGEKPVRLIMVARICEQKDHQLLLQALSKLKVTKDYVVDLVGDGPLLEESKQLVQEMGLEDRVNFLGSRTDVPELLIKSHVFLLISKWEGFPRSIIEAMRAGLPVVASDVGGTKEAVIDTKTGFLIPRGDLEGLIKGLEKIINQPKLRAEMGLAGHQRFLDHFTFEGLVEKTTKVYQEILNK